MGEPVLCIYRTLAVPGFIVGDSPSIHLIDTANGPVQVFTLPWLSHSSLFTCSETEGFSLAQVNELLLQRLQPVLNGEIRRLDPDIPTVLLGHLMADRAKFGSERFLAVGKGFTIPVSFLIRPEFDYVALGHVHKHQNLNPSNKPPVVYAGSIERVDFSEEKEEKGFVLIELAKGKAEWKFCPLPVRSFCTVEVDVSEEEEPEKAIVAAIEKKNIDGAVVRLFYKIRSEQLDLVNQDNLTKALSLAHTYTIRPELISQLARPRLPELGVGESLDPLKALETYLENRSDLRDLAPDMLTAAERLMEDSTQLAFSLD